MNNIWVLAQADSNGTPQGITSEPVNSEGQAITSVPDSNEPRQQTTRTTGSPWMQMLPFLLLFVVMYMILFRGPRKKQQEHKQMIQELTKGDKVQTIGGIIGSVMDIKDEEITLKIDESNNTKMKILRSAINRNLSKD